MKTSKLNILERRQWLRRVAGGMTLPLARVLGANDLIRGALVGCGTRGVGAVLPGAALCPDVEMVAACDVYKPNLDRALSAIHSQGGKAASYGDYRRIIERKDIDVVFVATPDHWHAPITVAACEAGKDVYVEKPLANSIEDCLAVVEAAGKHRRIVQVGVQQRTMKIYFDALEMIRAGRIGPVRRCSMVWAAEGGGRGRGPGATEPPDGLDWEMFQGPAPRRPYSASRQRSWRSYWEYGSGAITDFGVHMLDVAHWFMGIDTPLVSFGAGYHSPTRLPEQVPDIVDLVWKYDQFLATYSTRRDEWANTFWGELGTLAVNRNMLRLKPFPTPDNRNPEILELKGAESGTENIANHIRNFLDCVQSRQKPAADAETLAKSTIACLLAAMSVRTGKSYRFDGKSAREV